MINVVQLRWIYPSGKRKYFGDFSQTLGKRLDFRVHEMGSFRTQNLLKSIKAEKPKFGSWTSFKKVGLAWARILGVGLAKVGLAWAGSDCNTGPGKHFN